MKINRFEDIDAWKRGCLLAVDIYKLNEKDSLRNDYGLKNQMRRAAVSISSNISEGFERGSTAEFKRFLNIAKGSCGELRSQLYIAKALEEVKSPEIEALLNECHEISSMIQGLINHLKDLLMK